mgnify:CR=1 FL=1
MFYEEHIGFFKADPNDLDRGLAITNEKIFTSYKYTEKYPTDHFASLKTLLDDSNAIVISENDIDDVSFDYGWTSEYMYAMYEDDSFLHINKTPHVDENGIVDYIVITFNKEPVFGVFSDYQGWQQAAAKSSEYCVGDLEECEAFNDPDYHQNERR